MPAFIKTQRDEAIWAKAKSIAKNQYPDITEDDEDFWKITTGIYKKINKPMSKAAAAIDRISSDFDKILNIVTKGFTL